MSEKFEREVLQRLTAIETKIQLSSVDPERCARHEEKLKVANKRIERIERSVGRQNIVAMTMGAVGSGFALLAKYLFTKGP